MSGPIWPPPNHNHHPGGRNDAQRGLCYERRGRTHEAKQPISVRMVGWPPAPAIKVKRKEEKGNYEIS
jgi:hypothetical protein